ARGATDHRSIRGAPRAARAPHAVALPSHSAHERRRRVSARTPATALIEVFTARARAVGADVEGLEPRSLAERVVGLMRQHGAQTVIVPADVASVAPELPIVLGRAGVGLVPPESTPGTLAAADAAVTLAALGIAETGSVGLVGRDVSTRLAGMLPPFH